jgi:hypothetical protein
MATSAGKAMFWVRCPIIKSASLHLLTRRLNPLQDFVGAPENHGPKVVAFEGEFAFTEGHAQELKTIALAQQVGKRLRLFFSYNNAGIDDSLIGGVIPEKYGAQYDIANQFQSYGWNVFTLADGT